MLAAGDVAVGASFGLVFLDRVTEAPSQALDCADAAMYEAKRRGGGVAVAFLPQTRPSLSVA